VEKGEKDTLSSKDDSSSMLGEERKVAFEHVITELPFGKRNKTNKNRVIRKQQREL